MAVTYSTAAKNNRLQIMSDLVGGLTVAASTGTPTAGKLVIGTSSLSGAVGILASINLPTTPFTVSAGVATLAGVPLSATASATGTAAKAELRSNADVTVVSGLTVGTSAADIILGSVAIVSGQGVNVTSGTITHS